MRTPEQGHEAICLAHAMICAIENARDSIIDDCARLNMDTVVSFREFAQANTALVWADDYLASGTATCICEPIAKPPVTFRRIRPCDSDGCMGCGESRVTFLDSDGSLFCSKRCVMEWHGDDIEMTLVPATVNYLADLPKDGWV